MYGRSKALLAAALSLGAVMTPGLMAHAIPRPQAIVSKKQKRALFSGGFYHDWGPLIGTRYSRATVAQAKRAAKKARNIKRHKAALRRPA